MATLCRLLKKIGLFCTRAPIFVGLFCKRDLYYSGGCKALPLHSDDIVWWRTLALGGFRVWPSGWMAVNASSAFVRYAHSWLSTHDWWWLITQDSWLSKHDDMNIYAHTHTCVCMIWIYMHRVCIYIHIIHTQAPRGEATLPHIVCFWKNMGGHLWGKIMEILTPFENFRQGIEEEVKPGGENMKKGQRRTSANHIARVNIFVSNIMHKSCLSPAQPRKVTFLPDALRWASLASPHTHTCCVYRNCNRPCWEKWPAECWLLCFFDTRINLGFPPAQFSTYAHTHIWVISPIKT